MRWIPASLAIVVTLSVGHRAGPGDSSRRPRARST